jgi:hypothetical protein
MLLFSNAQKNYNLRYKAVNWKNMEIFKKTPALLHLSFRSDRICRKGLKRCAADEF